ncbi:hypothetical protein ACG33_09005 [Steroidobacter denitrificans]|uniref:DUF1249 domain-containing protein n=1 Tax=Steroidobacter denitrificans TaxID=465721 RepID=A0A127FC71_STEDE|nr:DUF1249 domain-containing protein [Steroidobacter denitrificans]AMN47230.1 hypothetical protein ACG33_09005 [Steroidobacter denitrificans]
MLVDAFETDTNCPVSWQARSRSFVSLMTLYESNHIRLSWLAPQLHSVCEPQVSRVEGDCPLHLALEDRSRYTTTLRLTYIFEDEAGPAADPDVRIRIYHDARLAEAQSCVRWHRHGLLESIRSRLARDMDERWMRNIMLNKWLEYCVERGHRFAGSPLR